MSWTSPLAHQRFDDISITLGPPDWATTHPGGGAGWEAETLSKHGLIFSSLRVMDEAIRHTEPMEHCDCLRVTIAVNIPLGYLHDVLAVSESIIYDRLKQKLTVRCHFIGAAIATLDAALSAIYHRWSHEAATAYLQEALGHVTCEAGLSYQYEHLVGLVRETWTNFPVKNKHDLTCDYTKFEVAAMPHELAVISRVHIL